MHDIFSIIGKTLTLVGALGMFLFGMKLMSESLQKVAGSKMRQILEKMTNNRFKGILTGVLITTTIQSSSATTVMVVSFVNAGLISLVGAVSVIMGANIGTTVTAWIISLLGFKISLSVLSLPLIGLSFPLFFSKNTARKSWGELIIGFAILFIGLEFLKDSVPDISQNQEILSFISQFADMGFLSVLIFVLIGTLLTIIIQSSSATMALTLVLCYNGLITFEMAAAMVLGENIGTTITANIASLVANLSAKRAARAHLIFNIFGVIWMLAIYNYFLQGIDWFLEHKHGVSILSHNLSLEEYDSIKDMYPIALSIFHTSFNILNTLILVGFTPLIVKTAIKMVPNKADDDEEFRLKYINSGFFSTDEIAILQANKEIHTFGIRLKRMFGFIDDLLKEDKPKNYYKIMEKIKKYEQITDNLELEIANYLTKVSEGEISHVSSKKIRAMLKIIDDMESIGDALFRLSIIIEKDKKLVDKFDKEQQDALRTLFDLLKAAFDEMNAVVERGFTDIKTKKAFELEDEINSLRDELRLQHVEDLKNKKYKHKVGTIYSNMISFYERIGDYIINVAGAYKEYKDIP